VDFGDLEGGFVQQIVFCSLHSVRSLWDGGGGMVVACEGGDVTLALEVFRYLPYVF
jgi:hypothetical protein